MKNFNIKEIRPDLPFKIKNNAISLPSIRDFRSQAFTIDFDVHLESLGINLQRPLVWTLHQRQEFILSIIRGVAIPTFAAVGVFLPGDKTMYKVIDGKQRLSTIFSFVDGEFPIHCGQNDFYFEELPEDLREYILRWEPTAQVAYCDPSNMIPDYGLIKWFYMINFAGTPQDREHLDGLLNAAKNGKKTGKK